MAALGELVEQLKGVEADLFAARRQREVATVEAAIARLAALDALMPRADEFHETCRCQGAACEKCRWLRDLLALKGTG